MRGLRSWHATEAAPAGDGLGSGGGDGAKGSARQRQAAMRKARAELDEAADAEASRHVSQVPLPRGFASQAPGLGAVEASLALAAAAAGGALAAAGYSYSRSRRAAMAFDSATPLYGGALACTGALALLLQTLLPGGGTCGIRPSQGERLAAMAGAAAALVTALAMLSMPNRLLELGVDQAALAAPLAWECAKAKAGVEGAMDGGALLEIASAGEARLAAGEAPALSAPLCMALALAAAAAAASLVPAAARWARAYAVAVSPPPRWANSMIGAGAAGRALLTAAALLPMLAAAAWLRPVLEDAIAPPERAPGAPPAVEDEGEMTLFGSPFSEGEWKARQSAVLALRAALAVLAAALRLAAARPALQGYLDGVLDRWYAYREGEDHSKGAREKVRNAMQGAALMINKAALQFCAPATAALGLAAPLALAAMRSVMAREGEGDAREDVVCQQAFASLWYPWLAFGTLWLNLAWAAELVASLALARTGVN